MIAYTGGAMRVGYWGHPVVIDLAGLSVSNVPILLNHRSDDLEFVLGQADEIKKTKNDLELSGSFLSASQQAQRVMELNDKGFKFQASVGIAPSKVEFVSEGQTAKANGREFSGPIHIARAGVLREVSFVVMGADGQTSAQISANMAEGAFIMTFEQWLKAKGFSLDDMSDAQKASMKAIFDSELSAAAATGDAAINAQASHGNSNRSGNASHNGGNFDSLIADGKAKQQRQSAIAEITARAIQDTPDKLEVIEALGRQAMAGDWDTQKYELELLRACMPMATPNIISRDSSEGITNDVITASVCLTGGLSEPEKNFDVKILEAANARWRSGLHLQDLLMFFAQRNGFRGSPRETSELLRFAFAPVRASGTSTLSLPGILSNVANKFNRRGFESVEQTWRSVAATRSVKDFKAITTYSLTGDFTYTEIPAGGKIDNSAPGELSYSNQAKSYGRMGGIDRRDIMNDDLGALTQYQFRIGRGGALKLNDVFWTAFLDNSSFFATGNANYLEGATAGTNDTRMNIEGLTRAEVLFLDQTDPDGKPMGAVPKLLLVPNALNATAAALMNSTEIRDTTASTKYPVSNPHAGKFTVVRSTYLSNSSFTGYSAAAWYLLADPMDVPVIEVAFLNGAESPTVESAAADFDTLGIRIRGYYDFGVTKQEYRGGVKMKGAA